MLWPSCEFDTGLWEFHYLTISFLKHTEIFEYVEKLPITICIFAEIDNMMVTRLSSLCLKSPSINVGISNQLHSSSVYSARRWKEKTTPEFASEFTNPIRQVAGMKAPSPEKGHVYDIKPFKVTVKEGCDYNWCGCGLARTQQPFCDLTCQNIYLKKMIKTGPIRYIATETKDVWFCNCKQTNHRPFCDGTHRDEEIQTKRLDGNRQLWEPRVKKSKKQ